jgi:L-amino acid N-acyltransferase YncA
MSRLVRLATTGDAEIVRRIYTPIVEKTPISFEEAPPSTGEIERRIENTMRETPWLVCESEGSVLGYAYAGRFRPRTAYQWTVEVTVYVDAAHRGKGIARRLYGSLLGCLRLQGYHTALAVIALPNEASVALHEGLGFVPVGLIPKIGYKLGRWHDVGWWRLVLQDYVERPEPPRPLPDLLDTTALERALEGDSRD